MPFLGLFYQWCGHPKPPIRYRVHKVTTLARQKLGQHFLHDASVLDRIAAAVCPPDEPRVIEIGPGRGALTEKLLARARQVVAIEIDPELAAFLKQRFASEPRLEIVHADALAIDPAIWAGAPVAGNLPYYIATPLIEKTIRSHPRHAVFLIQKEVADRLTATPGHRAYGYLTVATALFAHVRRLFDVKPGAFRPSPKVESTVVRLDPRAAAESVPVDDAAGFLRFAAAAFHQKRKTLRNNLAPLYGRALVETWPEANLRAEQLSLEQLLELYRRCLGQAHEPTGTLGS